MLEYVQRVNRLGSLARRYGFDALVVLTAVGAVLEVAFGKDEPDGSRTSDWLAAPAVALIVLPLLARRRFAFATPAAVWLFAAAFSFADGRLIPTSAGISVAGAVAAFLLGNLRDPVQGRSGLAIVLGGAAIITYNDPTHAA